MSGTHETSFVSETRRVAIFFVGELSAEISSVPFRFLFVGEDDGVGNNVGDDMEALDDLTGDPEGEGDGSPYVENDFKSEVNRT